MRLLARTDGRVEYSDRQHRPPARRRLAHALDELERCRVLACQRIRVHERSVGVLVWRQPKVGQLVEETARPLRLPSVPKHLERDVHVDDARRLDIAKRSVDERLGVCPLPGLGRRAHHGGRRVVWKAHAELGALIVYQPACLPVLQLFTRVDRVLAGLLKVRPVTPVEATVGGRAPYTFHLAEELHHPRPLPRLDAAQHGQRVALEVLRLHATEERERPVAAPQLAARRECLVVDGRRGRTSRLELELRHHLQRIGALA
mmetsp:Transcript_96647/g.275870  ORF Transcript_96647/g.275870 Transcript_96647/m.275870 type:complete len:260 (-) Transcript_96647:403-1182(-)